MYRGSGRADVSMGMEPGVRYISVKPCMPGPCESLSVIIHGDLASAKGAIRAHCAENSADAMPGWGSAAKESRDDCRTRQAITFILPLLISTPRSWNDLACIRTWLLASRHHARYGVRDFCACDGNDLIKTLIQPMSKRRRSWLVGQMRRLPLCYKGCFLSRSQY